MNVSLESWQTLDLLTALVEKSLVVFEEQTDGTLRYRLLETVRRYSRDRLSETEELATMTENHRAYFAEFWENAERSLRGPEQAIWLTRLESEWENLRAAVDAPSDAGPDTVEIGLRLASAAQPFCHLRGHFSEPLAWLTRLLALQRQPPLSPKIRGRALNAAGSFAWRLGDYPTARTFLEEARTLWQALGDLDGLSGAVNNLANVTWYQGDKDAAVPLYEENLSLARQTGNPRGLATALNNVGLVAQDRGDHARAQECFAEALTIRRDLGDPAGIANLIGNLSQTLMDQGNLDGARPLVAESLTVRRALGDRLGLAYALQYQGRLALSDGDWVAAHAAFAESLTLRHELGEKWGVAAGLERFAELAARQQHWPRAVRLWAAEDALCAAIGVPLSSDGDSRRVNFIAQARASLGEAAFASAWAAGHALTPDEAVADALQVPPSSV